MQNKKYGEYGGQYVAESLMNVLAELETAYNEAINDPKFIEEYNYYLKEYVGRETPLYFAEKLSLCRAVSDHRACQAPTPPFRLRRLR